MDTQIINLTKGLFTIVDNADYEKLKEWKWHALGEKGKEYAARRIGDHGRYLYMHRVITNAPPDKDVDHINRNRLDNRQINLRVCSTSQNCINREPNRNKKYKGITLDKRRNRWYAGIKFHQKFIFIGSYKTDIEAAIAYNQKAVELFGKFAYLNIISYE